MGESFLSTRKGPYCRGASFAIGWCVFRFCPSNHTCSPSLKFIGIEHSLETQRASLALSWASLICCNCVMTSRVFASSLDNRKGGFIPKRSSCGVKVILSWGHELWTNSARDRNSAQVDWLSAVQIHKYCSSHWLACLLVPSVCGWNAVETFCWMWRSQHNFFVKCDMNLGSQLLMIF